MSQKKTLNEIKSALPDLKSEKVEDYANELDRILAIKRVFQSEDGKEVLNVLKDNCSIALRKAVISARKGDKDTLLALILDYAANIDLISQVKDISMEKQLREDLDEAVKEAY